ncbi:DNA mismatch repair protein MutS [Robiginitalea sp. SC105]|uniref:MutS-related protein n=1 Tax=Robiginitalea sp. SC105 TaxID=2762332 RepID=UPI0016396BCD|nr:DNA mismatch repair protein MutS [Robiginitalea sp. SC105]MBC2838678.1 DNA mismatch repair protein MutS [Robiginitalea sp. SC105]
MGSPPMSASRQGYLERLDGLKQQYDRQLRRLRWLALVRVFTFLAAASCGYMAFTRHGAFAIGCLLLLALFAWMVGRYEDWKYTLRKLRELRRLNETEIRALELEFSDLPDGGRFRDASHAFSEDLEIFGPGSFFQYMNRCGLEPGESQLAAWLTDNEPGDVPAKQEAIRELAPQAGWRQDFYATGKLSGPEIRLEPILDWLEGYRHFTPSYFRFVPYAFALLSVLILAGYFSGMVTGWVLGGIFLSGLGICGLYLGRVGRLAADVARVQSVFEPCSRLVAKIEAHEFKAGLLQELKQGLAAEGTPVSARLREFSRYLAALDNRNNLLVALFGNGFLLWDLMQSRNIENWIAENGRDVRSWFECISAMDAWCSLGNFAFNHPGYAYPRLATGQGVIRAQALAHPLLQAAGRVANDFAIDWGNFHVITGANMAGKSTFLRTLSLAMVMANCGLPVCAAEFTYSPLPLVSSMRTSDSLARSESYFFAELKRLQFLVATLEERPCFVVLDEILKGTNSTDKARGSRLFLQRLVRSGATGVIATHDLSLCEVADTEPRVANWHFDAEVRGGELYFDYRLKPGICTGMNASFLLRKMGIVDE